MTNNDAAYPVTLTDNGFILNGQTFDRVASIGERGQAGQRAHAMRVKGGGIGRQWVIISNGQGRSRRNFNPYSFRLGSLIVGEWMESEGNFYLSQSGKTPMAIPTAIGTALALSLSTAEATGMDRLLGICCHSGVYFTAHYVANTGLDQYETLRFRAYTLTGTPAIAWTVDIPLSPTIACSTVPYRHFRANLFYDVDNRILTACDHKIWSLRVPLTADPTEYAATALDAPMNAAIVGDVGLLGVSSILATWDVIKRNNDTLIWSVIAEIVDVDPQLFATPGTSRAMSRPWPYNPTSQQWAMLSYPSWAQPYLSRISGLGALSTSTISITFPTPIELTSLLAAGDAYHEAADNYPYGFPYTSGSTTDPRPGHEGEPVAIFLHRTWAGTSAIIESDPAANGNFVTPRPVGVGHSTFAPDPYFAWGETDNLVVPALRQDSAGNLIYAVIESMPVITANETTFTAHLDPTEITCSMVVGLHHGDGASIYDYYIHGTEPTLATYAEASAVIMVDGHTVVVGGWYDSHDVAGQLDNYEFSHHPLTSHTHRTNLRQLSADGTPVWATDLSSGPFVGSKSYHGIDMTESLPFAENVHDIKLGPGDAALNWRDAIFVAQDRRTAKTDPGPRPCFRFVSSAGAIRSTLENLAPDWTVDPILATTSETFTATAGQSDFFLNPGVGLTPNSVSAAYVNDVAQSLTGCALVLTYHYQVTFTVAADDVVRIVYDYVSNPDKAGRYEYEPNAVCLAANISETAQFAIMGVYTDSIVTADTRTDIFLLDLSNPDAVSIATQLTEVNAYTLPQPRDFSRFTFTSGGIFWIGDQGAGPNFLKFE